jgi:GcrA cell cycle regulator
MNPPAWTAQEVATARELWDAGVSTVDIAKRVGRTKNAVCGLRKRRGWLPRPEPVQLSQEQRAARAMKARLAAKMARNAGAEIVREARKRAAKPRPKPVIVPPLAPPAPEPVSLYQLDGCRWIENDGRPWRFCCAPVVAGGPYCAEHRARCYLRRGERAWMLEAAP